MYAFDKDVMLSEKAVEFFMFMPEELHAGHIKMTLRLMTAYSHLTIERLFDEELL